jgi:hypothetical protein
VFIFSGYQRMMYLKWKYSAEMERLQFAPCPAIDLIWHTHLLHPAEYRGDMNGLLRMDGDVDLMMMMMIVYFLFSFLLFTLRLDDLV